MDNKEEKEPKTPVQKRCIKCPDAPKKKGGMYVDKDFSIAKDLFKGA